MMASPPPAVLNGGPLTPTLSPLRGEREMR